MSIHDGCGQTFDFGDHQVESGPAIGGICCTIKGKKNVWMEMDIESKPGKHPVLGRRRRKRMLQTLL